MADRVNLSQRLVPFALVSLLGSGALFGCGEAPDIEVQEVPPLEIEEAAFPGLTSQEDAILVATIPLDQIFWVFRIRGDAQQIEELRPDFADFVESLSFAGGGRSLPDWQLPAGWTRDSSPQPQLRDATILVPTGDDDGEKLELTVSRLPLLEDSLHAQLRNYNRWLGQLQRPPVNPAQMQKQAENVALAEDKIATVFYMPGKLKDSLGGGGPMMGQGSRQPARRPTGQASSSPEKGSAAGKLSYTVPARWQEQAATGERRGFFLVSNAGKTAELTVTAFSSAPVQMSSPAANVARWRRQVGLGPASEDELLKPSEQIKISGRDGMLIFLEGDSQRVEKSAMWAAMVEVGPLVWFFKLWGPPEAVTPEGDRFREFLSSVQIPGA